MKKSGQSIYIGYDSAEEWLSAVNRSQPVFANLVREPGRPGRYGMRVDQLVIMMAQPQEDLVHYCRLPVGELTFVGDQPFHNDHERRITLAEQAWGVVQGWLQERGLAVRKGVIAVPDGLRLLSGGAGFLAFDEQGQAYRRGEE